MPAPASRRAAPPAWMVTLLVALVMMAIVGGVYYFISSRETRAAAPAASAATLETPSSTPTSGAHPYAKYMEVTGLRIIEVNRKPHVKFILVNHSNADLAPSAVVLTLRTTNSKPQDAPLTSFRFETPELQANESREITRALDTKLRAYELPDWQFLQANLDIK